MGIPYYYVQGDDMHTFLYSIILLFAIPHITIASEKLVFTGIKGAVNSDIGMDVLTKAYSQLGIKILYRPLPGERALRVANSGKVDGEVFRIANVQKRYKNLIQVPTQINILPAIAYTKGKKININGWHSLKSYRIGIQVGIKFAERGTKGMNPTRVDTNEQLFKMLDSGRIDLAIAAQSNGLKTLKKLNTKQISGLTPAIEEYPLYHYLHKKNAHLINKLNAVLIKMTRQGEIKAIRENHLKKFSRDK